MLGDWKALSNILSLEIHLLPELYNETGMFILLRFEDCATLPRGQCRQGWSLVNGIRLCLCLDFSRFTC